MGLGPSIGYNKSYQWLDQQVKDILELLEYQNERIKTALRGNGAFYTYVYIACSSLDALSAAQALAKSTWQNEMAMVQPCLLYTSETRWLNNINCKAVEKNIDSFSFSDLDLSLLDANIPELEGADEIEGTISQGLTTVSYTHLSRVVFYLSG